MSKGLRLKFYGKECAAEEVKLLARSLGYDPLPVFSGWGTLGGYRNFFGCNSNNKNDEDFIACENLVKNGLMYVENGKSWSCCDRIFHVTDFGKKWFSAFMHKHPHADWKSPT